MNTEAARAIANAVLYEGYMLYPYRPSSVKNQQRFNFGVLYPRAYCDAANNGDTWISQTQFVLRADLSAEIEIRVKFLHMVDRQVLERVSGTGEFRPVDRLVIDSKSFSTWQEAVEHELALNARPLAEFASHGNERRFNFEETVTSEAIRNSVGTEVGKIVRRCDSVELALEVSATKVAEGVVRLSIRVMNSKAVAAATHRPSALLQASVSTHVILGIAGGMFVSHIDPPDDLREHVSQCQNVGLFPVLVGHQGDHDTLLASPIILYDYPEIATESAGDLFDGTEIDEILSLRILTLTEGEKQEVRSSDERSRMILDRTEAMPAEQFMKLHGILRGMRPAYAAPPGRSNRHE